MKKLLLASILSATAFATTAVANDAIVLQNNSSDHLELYDAVLIDGSTAEPIANFGRLNGTILAINELPDGARGVLVGESADDLLSAKQFNIHAETVVLGDLEVGVSVSGFFNNHGPMTMSIPAQVAAVALVTADAALSVAADRFIQHEDTDNLINDAGTLLINIADSTDIQDIDGNPVDWNLSGRNLIVVYGVSTRSIPALATPSLVIVLPVHGVMPTMPVLNGGEEVNDDLSAIELGGIELASGVDEGADQTFYHIDLDNLVGLMPTVDPIDLTGYPIIVEGAGVSFDFVELNDTVYVPIRAIVEAIGGQLEWNPTYPRVQVIWNDHAFLIYVGTNEFVRDTEALTLDWESVIIDGSTFVPLAFFREVMGFNNAYFHGGHVQINSFEAME